MKYLFWECKSKKLWGLEKIEPPKLLCNYRKRELCFNPDCDGYLLNQEERNKKESIMSE